MDKPLYKPVCRPHIGIKIFDTFLLFLISIGFMDFFVEKTYNNIAFSIFAFFIIFLGVLLVYNALAVFIKRKIRINEKSSDIFINISVVICTYTFMHYHLKCIDESYPGYISSILFLFAGFLCLYCKNFEYYIKYIRERILSLSIKESNEYDISEYWIKTFGKQYNEVIYEHERCVSQGINSRLINAYNYIVSDKNMHTKIYTKRVTYIWLIEALFLSGEVFLYKNKSSYGFDVYAMLLIAILGICSTILWIHTLNGAKYCEENAEKHLAMLEEPIMGNISKVLWIDKHKKQPISVTNFYICIMFFVLWSVLICVIIYNFISPYFCYLLILLFTFMIFIIYMKYMRREPLSEIRKFKYIS